jgi:hypothetical protein
MDGCSFGFIVLINHYKPPACSAHGSDWMTDESPRNCFVSLEKLGENVTWSEHLAESPRFAKTPCRWDEVGE